MNYSQLYQEDASFRETCLFLAQVQLRPVWFSNSRAKKVQLPAGPSSFSYRFGRKQRKF
jgi:hypothetical protein